jgi:hypothetical protein
MVDKNGDIRYGGARKACFAALKPEVRWRETVRGFPGPTGFWKTSIHLRLFQNFSFWNSFLEFSGKTGLLPVFPGAWLKTNRVLEQAHL